ncbi:hypothetical protein F511_18892 [Dorcoceras hygrometricum]|uniref:Uncharacterized protein n=1 Tax=Dorcoceras hygrometricum TaxID=472368 RepID=A0A2Z7AJ13_9LAMI|nr:hypothetical protein F511_18892 [Dorcoceras hygrometricum]
MPIVSRQRKTLPQRPFVDAFAPICIFIEPVQDLYSRKPYSGIVQRLWAEICVDIVQFSLFEHLQPVGTYNLCTDIVAAGPVVDIDAVPTGIFDAFQHRLDVEGYYDFFVQPVIQYISSSSSSESSVPIIPRSASVISSGSSSSASSMHFTDDFPQIRPVVHPSIAFTENILKLSADYTDSFAQLQASIDQIQLEQVRTRDAIDELKDSLSSKITNIEMAFEHAYNHQEIIFRNQIFDVQQEIKTQKAALSQDLDDFQKETQEGINTLSAQLSEIIAYINRGHDEKKGEESSRGPPPDVEADLVVEVADLVKVAVEVNHLREVEDQTEVEDLIKKEGTGVRGGTDGFLEEFFLFQFLYKTLVLSCS